MFAINITILAFLGQTISIIFASNTCKVTLASIRNIKVASFSCRRFSSQVYLKYNAPAQAVYLFLPSKSKSKGTYESMLLSATSSEQCCVTLYIS